MINKINITKLIKGNTFWAYYRCRTPKEFVFLGDKQVASAYGSKYCSTTKYMFQRLETNTNYEVEDWHMPYGFETEEKAIAWKSADKVLSAKVYMDRVTSAIVAMRKRTPTMSDAIMNRIANYCDDLDELTNELDSYLMNTLK